jgi:hypothetical protein
VIDSRSARSQGYILVRLRLTESGRIADHVTSALPWNLLDVGALDSRRLYTPLP